MMNRWRDHWDLISIILLSLLLNLIIFLTPESVLRKLLGIPFILFFPGYVLIATLFPDEEDLDNIERIALSFGLSIAIVPLIGLTLNYIWEIRLIPILISLTAFTLLFGVVSIYRREKSMDPWIPEISIERIKEEIEWERASKVDKVLTVILVIAIISSLFVLGYIITHPKPGEKFTEFYILGEYGKASDYPTDLLLGEEGKVIIGIVNHEYRNVTYFIEIWLVNATYDVERNQTVIHEMHLLDVLSVTLPHQPVQIEGNWTPQWETNYTLRINEPGTWQVWFLLFKDLRPELTENNASQRIYDAIEGKIQSLKLNVKVRGY
jgi:uncharacterized membrane protein